jgi:hypothetical protein
MAQTHENTNCLAGLKCPKCGSLGPLWIQCSVAVVVHDDGTDEECAHEWDDKSACSCRDCKLNGKIKDFRVEGAGKFCHDPRHEKPCPLPCEACKEECDPELWKTVKGEQR